MGSKSISIAVNEDEEPDKGTQVHPLSTKMSKSKEMKVKFKAGLSRSTHKLFPRTPKTFPRFNDLPDELQVLIISFALAYPRFVDIKRPPPGADSRLARLSCTRSTPLLYVSHKFREEVLQIRPLSFPIYYRNRQLVPAAVPFNFATDKLILPQAYIYKPRYYMRYYIKGLEKLSTLIISWVNTSFEEWEVEGLVGLGERGIKKIALIPQALLDYAGKSRYGTYEGPFSAWEEEVREDLERKLSLHQTRYNVAVPKIVCFRLTRYGSAEQCPPDWIYKRLKKFRDGVHYGMFCES